MELPGSRGIVDGIRVIVVGSFMIRAVISQYMQSASIAVKQAKKSFVYKDNILSMLADIIPPMDIKISAFFGAFIVIAKAIVPKTQVTICIIKSNS